MQVNSIAIHDFCQTVVKSSLFLLSLTLVTSCSVGGGRGLRHESPLQLVAGQTNVLILEVVYFPGRPKKGDISGRCYYRNESSTEWSFTPLLEGKFTEHGIEMMAQLKPISKESQNDQVFYYFEFFVRGKRYEHFSREKPRAVPFKP